MATRSDSVNTAPKRSSTATSTSSQPSQTFWQRAKTNSKLGFDSLWRGIDKVGAPVNNLSNKLGSEAFWPTNLEAESEKAARILRSFCSTPPRIPTS